MALIPLPGQGRPLPADFPIKVSGLSSIDGFSMFPDNSGFPPLLIILPPCQLTKANSSDGMRGSSRPSLASPLNDCSSSIA
jgi:hypothetical protein